MIESLEGKRAVVTGASRGIGRAVAAAFLLAGADVAACARREEHLGDLAPPAGRRLVPCAADLADAQAAHRLGEAIAERFGPIDVLVNNAGVLGERAPLADCDLDLWQRAVAVNLTGLLALTQALLPAIAPGGAIINVTSGAAGRAGWGAYSVTKLALDGLTVMLREELAPRRIRCVAINPGPARTAMRAAAHPDEDPATVPSPTALTAPFVAVAAGADPGPRIEAARWGR